MSAVLRRVVAPMSGETAASFASRLAARNGTTLAEFCYDMAVPLSDVVHAWPSAVERLMALAGSEARRFIESALIAIHQDRWSINSQMLTAPALLSSPSLVCPGCLFEDLANGDLLPTELPYCRSSWLVSSIRTCTTHGMILHDLGPEADAGVRHDFATRVEPLLTCMPKLCDRTVRREPSGFEVYLQGRLRGETGVAPWLDALEFHAAALLCERVGVIAAFGRKKHLKTLGSDEWWSAGRAGFELLLGGEEAMRGFLSELQSTYHYRRSGNEGPRGFFGTFWQWLERRTPADDLEPVLAIVRDHVINNVALAAGTEVLGVKLERRKLHSIRSASLEFGKHPQRFRRTLAYEKIISESHESKVDALVVFDAESNRTRLSRIGEQLSLSEVELYMNAPRPRAALLHRLGFITADVRLDNRRVTRLGFARSQVDHFMRSLLEGSTEVEGIETGAANIPTAAKQANCGIGEVVRLVLDRKLNWVGRRSGVGGFMSVLVKVEEVSRHVRGPEVDGLAEYKVVKRLKVSEQAVRKLIEHKVLGTRRIVNPVNRCPTVVVPLAEIAAFQATYVALFALAQERGVHHRKLKKWLVDKGIFPDLPGEKFMTSFYRRDVIPI